MASADRIYAQLAVLKKQDQELTDFAACQADSIIRALHLMHPMTLPAAIKVVCEAGFTELEDVAHIALALHAKLNGAPPLR